MIGNRTVPDSDRVRSLAQIADNVVELFTVITWLLQHNPHDRPSALELSQSSLLPPRMEDEYLKGALKMMSTCDFMIFLLLHD